MKKKKKSSLAEQLAALDTPAPTELDPENAEDYQSSESDGYASDEDFDTGREHYAAVGQSRIRDTAVEQPLKAEYKGQKTNRKEIFEGSDDDVSEEEDRTRFEDESEDLEVSEASIESGTEEEQEVVEQDLPQSSGSDQSDVDSENESEESSDEAADAQQAADLKKMLADDQKAMVQAVVKTATADAEKGRAVKKQLTIYDSLLDCRIKLQKGLQCTNEMSERNQETDLSSAITEAESSALGLIDTLLSIRDDMLVQDLSVVPEPRKRKYADVENVDLDEVWRDMNAHSDRFSVWRDRTLTKWSDKIRSASGGIDKSKKFKVLDQSILAQIKEAKSDREKLRKRTQVQRFRNASKSTISSEDVSEEIFDDGDFYQQMLKDLIDSRMLDSASGNQMKWLATRQPKQKKDNVDTRASKGRKLRYHIHEKIQNFMAPAATGTWHEEQKDELFGSLLGQRLRVDEDDDAANESSRANETIVQVGEDFRLFR